jgi:hypothetical protein
MARNTRTRRIALAAGIPAAAAVAALIASAASAAASGPAAAHHPVKPAIAATQHQGRAAEPGDLRGRGNEPGEDVRRRATEAGEDVRGQEREPGDDRGQERRDDRNDDRGALTSRPGHDDSGHVGPGHDGGDDR